MVYSKETPLKPSGDEARDEPAPDGRKSAARRDTPGSTAFVPATAGLIIAGEVIRDLCKDVPKPESHV